MSKIELYHNKPLSLDLIEKTFEASFNIEFDKAYWEWRFLNNPNSNKTYISYIIEDEVLAAYYAVSPLKIMVDGKEQKIALSNMTMTHPNYRGRGYFKKLAQKLFENLKNEGFVGVFGFANHNSHYGFRKYLNWADFASLNIFNLKANNFIPPNNLDYKIEFTIENINSDSLKYLSKLEAVHIAKTHLIRDEENIKWRLLNNPSNQYKVQIGKANDEVKSLLFFKNYNTEIDIIEFYYNSEIQANELLIHNIDALIKNENTAINIWSNLHSEEHLLLEKHGFQETIFNSYFGLIPLDNNNKLLDFSNWHYRFLDSDIF